MGFIRWMPAGFLHSLIYGSSREFAVHLYYMALEYKEMIFPTPQIYGGNGHSRPCRSCARGRAQRYAPGHVVARVAARGGGGAGPWPG